MEVCPGGEVEAPVGVCTGKVALGSVAVTRTLARRGDCLGEGLLRAFKNVRLNHTHRNGELKHVIFRGVGTDRSEQDVTQTEYGLARFVDVFAFGVFCSPPGVLKRF